MDWKPTCSCRGDICGLNVGKAFKAPGGFEGAGEIAAEGGSSEL